MNDVRWIALDLDGTLLDDDKQIPAANILALKAAVERGVGVAVSSGRMICRIEPIAERLGIDCALVAYNGGHVVGRRAEGRPTIHHAPLPADVADLLLDFSRESGILLNFYLDDLLYAEDGPRRRPFIDLYSRRTGAEYNIVDLDTMRGRDPTKLILLAEPDECDRLRERFSVEFAGRATFTKSEREYLEITAVDVDKAHGLEALGRHYGCTLEEILAIGDAENDIDMIVACGTGVALANATAGTKAIADVVTERTNNEAGVAEAVERFVLAR